MVGQRAGSIEKKGGGDLATMGGAWRSVSQRRRADLRHEISRIG
jgi:hypothetical protein